MLAICLNVISKTKTNKIINFNHFKASFHIFLLNNFIP